jgi:hypothetical protein
MGIPVSMTTDSGPQHPNVTLAVLALPAPACSLLQSLVAPGLPAIQHVLEAVPPGQTGVATGVNTIVRGVGGALGTQVIASLLASSVLAAIALPCESGLTLAFPIASALLVLSAAVALAIPGRRAAAAREAAPEASVA